jgi:predicted nucleic-acid-binding protein
VIGLDTNVVVRYLAQDDARQSATATRFMEKSLSAEEPGFISLIVLVEVVWVLASSYSMVRSQIAEVVEALLTTEQLRIESAEFVWRAKRRFTESKADFSDALIAECASAVGCRKIVTFDRGATTSAGFELLA